MATTKHETSAHYKEPSWDLDEPKLMVLAGEDRDVFVAAVVDPPAPTAKLVAALQKLKTTET